MTLVTQGVGWDGIRILHFVSTEGQNSLTTVFKARFYVAKRLPQIEHKDEESHIESQIRNPNIDGLTENGK